MVYGLPVAALALRRADGTRRGELVKDASALIAGAIVPVAIIFSWMAGAGALKDLIDATIDYNLQYSGETYPSRPAMLLYLMTFPIRQARLDSLWFLGGLGSAVLITVGVGAFAGGKRTLAVPSCSWRRCGWRRRALRSRSTAVADLPRYLSAGQRTSCARRRHCGRVVLAPVRPLWRTLTAGLLAIAVLRIANFERWPTPRHTIWLTCAARSAAAQYLSRFGRADSGDKYSAKAVADLASYLRDAHPSGPIGLWSSGSRRGLWWAPAASAPRDSSGAGR